MTNKYTFQVKKTDKSIELICPDSDIKVTNSIFTNNEYPIQNFHAYEPTSIIDIGAGIGASAIYFDAFYPRTQIHCFEPSPRSFQYLKLNTENKKNINIHNYGLFNKEVTASLHLGNKHFATDSISYHCNSSDNTTNVQLKNAKDVLDKISIGRKSILKIDTEGCEVPILNNIKDMLPCFSLAFFEYHSEQDRREIDEILKDSFLLYHSMVLMPHRGLLSYISLEMAEGYKEQGLLGKIIPRPNY